MKDIVPVVAKILAVMTVLTDIGIVLFFISLLAGTVNGSIRNLRTRILTAVAPSARILAFVVALTAMSGSLFYSEIAQFTPCLLCWWQRIFMYPQTVLIAMGIIKNDRHVADYSIGLSAIGGVIALYHYYIQLGGKTFFSCAQVGYSASCTQRFSLEFGYVSIPMMALTAFVAIIMLMVLSKRQVS